ncbi:MAG: tetratricopeptide repeat protein [Thermoguttaceae bacterium]|nr:tetratricopeptide repeat protein [Thermoguttaceae bacterium]
MGEPKKALALLDRLSGAIEQTADYLALRGATVAATCENPDEAVNLYERAYKADSNHPETLFGLALESERRGNDDEALALYRQASHCFPTSVGTLMNLGVLLEDKELYEEAADCYNRVIEAFPNNKRARLFLKDAQDHLRVDTRTKPNPPGSRHLLTPINEIEFSSRVRRVIEELGCKTLGDLARQTQADLLRFENFGDNSLKEIELKLEERELHLGWTDDEILAVPEYKPTRGGFAAAAELAGGEDLAVLARPVTDLELSRRAANCLKKRNVKTIGELIKQSADDLMETANFGVTSLKEIREKLASKFALKLKGDETQGK